VTYQEFINALAENNVHIKDIALALGYSKESISNNWKKTDEIPKRVTLSMDMYFRLKDIEENNKIEYKLGENILSEEAIRVAKEKCKKHNLTLESYLSSLVLSHI